MKIGVVLVTAEINELNRTHRYAEIRAMARQAEAAGLDSIWLYDHMLYRPEEGTTIGIWEAWTILSALAEATERVELGPLVLCNSFRNPAILAKMATTLDEVSGGRLILGIGAGWNKPEYDAFGLPFDHRVDRLEEALQIIGPLLREGRADFAGTYYQARDCEITPRGPRANGPPLLVAGSGPRMLRLAARYADLWDSGYLAGPETLAEPLAGIQAACAEVGRDPATLSITGIIVLHFPDLGPPPAWIERSFSGSTEEIAAALRAYEELGVAHLIFHCSPYSAEAVGRLGEAVRIYRQSGASIRLHLLDAGAAGVD